MRLLYVTWDGPDSPYLESLFFPVFERLARLGVHTHVLQFAWNVHGFRDRVARAAATRGVGYEVHEVLRQPLHAATALAVTSGALRIAAAARRHRSDVVMPRSHLPAAMALAARPLLGARPLVWDSDGLMPDERLDFGGWRREGLTYRFFAAVERQMMTTSDATLTRTRAARALLLERGGSPDKLSVVPNGKDADEFHPADQAARGALRARLGLPTEGPLIVYAGAIGPQYLAPQMARLFREFATLLPAAHFLGLTAAQDELRRALGDAGVDAHQATVLRVPPGEVASWLRAADLGLSLRTPTPSMCAVSPIKVAEYLLSGVPVIANAGVGDLADTFTGSTAGLVLTDTSERSLREGAYRAAESILLAGEAPRRAARELGLSMFSLDAAAHGYAASLSARSPR